VPAVVEPEPVVESPFTTWAPPEPSASAADAEAPAAVYDAYAEAVAAEASVAEPEPVPVVEPGPVIAPLIPVPSPAEEVAASVVTGPALGEPQQPAPPDEASVAGPVAVAGAVATEPSKKSFMSRFRLPKKDKQDQPVAAQTPLTAADESVVAPAAAEQAAAPAAPEPASGTASAPPAAAIPQAPPGIAPQAVAEAAASGTVAVPADHTIAPPATPDSAAPAAPLLGEVALAAPPLPAWVSPMEPIPPVPEDRPVSAGGHLADAAADLRFPTGAERPEPTVTAPVFGTESPAAGVGPEAGTDARPAVAEPASAAGAAAMAPSQVPPPPPSSAVEGPAPAPVAPVHQPLGGYESHAPTLDQYTCNDCVYVETCPRKGEQSPATCGLFQWKA
jgi:hypothetical protein